MIAAVWFHEITAGSKNMGAHATSESCSFRLSGFIRRPQLLLLPLRRHCGRLASPYCSSPHALTFPSPSLSFHHGSYNAKRRHWRRTKIGL